MTRPDSLRDGTDLRAGAVQYAEKNAEGIKGKEAATLPILDVEIFYTVFTHANARQNRLAR